MTMGKIRTLVESSPFHRQLLRLRGQTIYPIAWPISSVATPGTQVSQHSVEGSFYFSASMVLAE